MTTYTPENSNPTTYTAENNVATTYTTESNPAYQTTTVAMGILMAITQPQITNTTIYTPE